MKYFLSRLLKAYKNFISPLLGNHCRFTPSCSEYAEQAILKKGIFSGGILSFKRILKCNPFHSGGVDNLE